MRNKPVLRNIQTHPKSDVEDRKISNSYTVSCEVKKGYKYEKCVPARRNLSD